MRVEIQDASKSFGDVLVFDGFSCTIEPGQVTALVGPSGSGKSTLLAAMAGFQRLDSGRVIYEHADGTTEPPSPQHVAWVPQGANALGARTAIDNVMLSALAAGAGLETARRAARDQLEKVGMTDRMDTLAKYLSGGELQRVGFARALAAKKPLIFADEPTSSLDAANTEHVAELLHTLRESATIVVATHDPRLVESARHVIQVRRGHGSRPA
ncbi:ATP-binding cassette domain-containing protein [Agromyces sp. H66]|uniref:ABC transporter ATP-binding protein n=1 Tax=Agromyces sp. H66 TaxID=2529859 RepID=UPI0010AAA67F|nr:ATP-binding cassette domain-containing protein [Agromyces sp. H66]